ncbi:hypothetical protein ALY90_15580, partial [Salmonella enterica subsp. enterica serovar Agona]|nr:hypothetical protein [Salmonella enterica subsp. enterica serovar Agona]
ALPQLGRTVDTNLKVFDISEPVEYFNRDIITRVLTQVFTSPLDKLNNYLKASVSIGPLREGANKRGNSSRLTQSFHFFMFEPIFSPVNALNQPI